MQTIHNYILFPENLDDSLDLDNAEISRNLIKEFQMIIDLADCEIGSKLYYSKSNKDKFLDNIKTFEDLSNLNIGSYDFETFINTIFNESNVLAVNESIKTKCKINTYNSKQGGLDDEKPILFNDIINRSRELNEDDKQIVINLFNYYTSQNPIMIILDCNGDVKNIYVHFVTNFHELDKWLIENRIKRNYSWNDNRHIENHPQSKISSHNKSPLIGGQGGKRNAEDLLQNAIGDKRNESNKLDLMNFDPTNKAYIWYEDENANNQYHAYHLVKTKTYERDIKAESRISDRVIKILKFRESFEL